jgi:hypothetical protein
MRMFVSLRTARSLCVASLEVVSDAFSARRTKTVACGSVGDVLSEDVDLNISILHIAAEHADAAYTIHELKQDQVLRREM